MEFIFFIGGAIAGTIITSLLQKCYKTYGVIEVDHEMQSCKFRMTSHDLLDRKNKKAVFDIDHDAVFSREEQML